MQNTLHLLYQLPALALFLSIHWTAQLPDTSPWTRAGVAEINVKSVVANKGYLYAGTVGQGVFTSSDGGITWQQSSQGLTNLHVFCLALYDKTIFAGTRGGVYCSEDNGRTWLPKNAGMPAETRAYSLIAANGILYAGSRAGIYVSADKGASWTLRKPGTVEEPYVYSLASHGQDVYAGTQGNGLYKSSDQGNTWTLTSNGIPMQTIGALLYANNIWLCATDGEGIFSSTDAGASWTGYSTGLGSPKVFSLITHNSKVYAATLAGIFVLDAKANPWQGITNDGLPPGIVINTLWIDNNKLYAATEKGLYVKTLP